MASIKKILCAVDLSEDSSVIADYAVTLAKACDAEIVVTYSAPEMNQYVGVNVPTATVESFVSEVISGAEASMRDFINKYFKDVPTTGKVLHGYAAEEVLAFSEKESIDLIVMGTHGRKGVQRLLFGSVAEKIVRNSSVPVLTVCPTK